MNKDNTKKKVLIVEDHKDMLVVLRKYLEDQNFDVIEAETGESGIEKFETDKPDLILLDIMLPGISGLDVISKIKNGQSQEKYVPIIIITAKNDISDIVKGLGSGADDYIVKPFHFDELIARVESALRLKKLNELLINQTLSLENANKKINGLNSELLDKNKELRKNIYGLHSLFEVSMDLSSILELEGLINSTLLTIIGQYSIKSAMFMMANSHVNNQLEIIDSKGFDNELKGVSVHNEDTLVNYFIEHPMPILLEDLKSKINTSHSFDKLEQIGIGLVAPVVIKRQVSGLICFGPRLKEEEFEDREIQQITILTNIISIAVNNASLYKDVEQLSYTDGMTELHNYRYFELRLKEEIIRHKRTKAGLSLLILDVDYFKNFNDTLGHQAGDNVLRKLGKLLKETARENDIVARYGGEEFAVILPTVDQEGAVILAERIRENVEKAEFDGEHVQPNGKITVSIGEASLVDTSNFEELIRKADLALYSAKESGRNRVQTYTSGMNGNK
ncbi:MAG: diguanylate cyclase [Calditrichaeota bacterium]|nr:MAG: diguanylate cyclase [Calditrichota bacterium]MBL1206735.1 diguanylate cyclase [Calditrichota bacterium]NOG46561.1 diguanylate cyclase [Calditrichota bacterium]